MIGLSVDLDSLADGDFGQTFARWAAIGGVDTLLMRSLVPNACVTEGSGRQYRASTVSPKRVSTDSGAPEVKDVLSVAHEQGLRVFSELVESDSPQLALSERGWIEVLEVDAFGRRGQHPCFRNRDYGNLWLGLVEEQLKRYSFDGVYTVIDRIVPLDSLVRGAAPECHSVCFCTSCQQQGAIEGIDIERARDGWQRLGNLLSGQSDPHPGGENPAVLVLRLLLDFPEILGWQSLWMRGWLGLQQRMYGVVKLLAPDARVGWQLAGGQLTSPIHRALDPVVERARWTDFCCYPASKRPKVSSSVLGISASTAEAFAAAVLTGYVSPDLRARSAEDDDHVEPPTYVRVDRTDDLDRLVGRGIAGVIYPGCWAGPDSQQYLEAAGRIVRKEEEA